MITAQASYGVAGSDVSATLVGSLPNGYNFMTWISKSTPFRMKRMQKENVFAIDLLWLRV